MVIIQQPDTYLFTYPPMHSLHSLPSLPNALTSQFTRLIKKFFLIKKMLLTVAVRAYSPHR